MSKPKQVIIYAIMFMAVWSLVGCGVPKSEYEVLKQKYAKMQKEMEGFDMQAQKVQQENRGLRGRIKELEEQVKKLSEENKIMMRENQTLLKENQALQR